MQANTILKSLRGGAIALALIAATALPQTTSAGSIQSCGDLAAPGRASGRAITGAMSAIITPRRSIWRRPTPTIWIMATPTITARPLITIMAPALPLAGPESASPSALIRLRHSKRRRRV